MASHWNSLAGLVQSQLSQQLQLFLAHIESQDAELAQLRTRLQAAEGQLNAQEASCTCSRGRQTPPAPAAAAAHPPPPAQMPAAKLDRLDDAPAKSTSVPSLPAPSVAPAHAAATAPSHAAAATAASPSPPLQLAATPSQPSQQFDAPLALTTPSVAAPVPAPTADAPAPSTPAPAATLARKKRAASPTALADDRQSTTPARSASAATPAPASTPPAAPSPAAPASAGHASKRARVDHAQVAPALSRLPSAGHMQMDTQPLPVPRLAPAHTLAPVREPSLPAQQRVDGSAAVDRPGQQEPVLAGVSAARRDAGHAHGEQQQQERKGVPPMDAVPAAVSAAATPVPARVPSADAPPAPSPSTPTRPSALAVVSAAFPEAAREIAHAATAAAAAGGEHPSLPPSQPAAPPLCPLTRAQAESDVSAAISLSSRGDWAAAEARLTAAISAVASAPGGGWPAVPPSWLKQRSTTYAKLGRNTDAFADAHRMIRYSPREWGGYYVLSTLLGRDKEYARALAECRRAWRRVPKRLATAATIIPAGGGSGSQQAPSAAASAKAEREAESDRRKVAERLHQLEQKLHLPLSKLDFDRDPPEEPEEEQEEEQEERKVQEAGGQNSTLAPPTAGPTAAPHPPPPRSPRTSRLPPMAPFAPLPLAQPPSPSKGVAAAAAGATAAAGSSAASASASPSHAPGTILPLLTLGTHKLSASACYDACLSALRCGWRRIDTAASYGNEEAVGRALASSGLPRASVHLTTKIAWADLTASPDAVYQAALGSLSRLGVAYVDLLLLHHPGRARLPPSSPLHAASRSGAWRALERLQAEGRARRIGVSNFELRHVEGLLEGSHGARVAPSVNQLELHPLAYEQQRELVEGCRERGLAVEAYSPLASGNRELMAHPLLLSLARSLRRSPAEVLLRWSLQHGLTPVVKAASHAHQKANLALVADPPPFSLSDEQMRTLDELGQGKEGRRFAWRGSMDPKGYA